MIHYPAMSKKNITNKLTKKKTCTLDLILISKKKDDK